MVTFSFMITLNRILTAFANLPEKTKEKKKEKEKPAKKNVSCSVIIIIIIH